MRLVHLYFSFAWLGANFLGFWLAVPLAAQPAPFHLLRDHLSPILRTQGMARGRVAAGLDAMDRRYLSTIALNYGGGPVGVETMAAALSEPRDAIEDIIEPFLIQCGYLQRTPRGRLLTPHAFKHLGLPTPQRPEILQGVLPLEDGDA